MPVVLVTSATTFFALYFAALLHCICVRFDEGFIQGKGIVFCVGDLFLKTQVQFRPPLMVAYGETAAFAAK